MSRLRLAIPLWLCVSLPPLHAQEDALAPLYEVEVIAFRNLDQRGTTPEAPGPEPTAEAAPLAVPEAAYPPLPPQALRLGAIAAKLRKGGSYQLLYHGGWTQAVARQNLASPTPLPRGAADAGVRGAITLYRERYLHALVDVALAEGHMHQGRRVRGQNIQYFDHPQFGVILALRPVNAGATNEAAEDAPPP